MHPTFFTVLFLTLTEYSSFQMMHILVRGYGLVQNCIQYIRLIGKMILRLVSTYVNRKWLSEGEKTLYNFWNAMILLGTQIQETFRRRSGARVSSPGMMPFLITPPFASSIPRTGIVK